MGNLNKFKVVFVLALTVSVVFFFGSFFEMNDGIPDEDYLAAQQNLHQPEDRSKEITIPFISRPVYTLENQSSVVDTITLNANPGPPNNGGSAGWAMFLDLIAGSNNIIVTQMSTGSTAAANASFSVEIFTRTGTALGGPVGSGPGSSTAGWTSLGTVPVTQGPTASGISLFFSVPPIMVPAGDTVGVAIRFTGAGPRYFGTGTPPYSNYSDANITLTTGDGRSVPFTPTGSWFASRALTGAIRYVVDAPVNCDYSWSTQTSGTTQTLYSVKSVNGVIGWVAGANATVRKTTNGGATWTDGNPNPGVINGAIYAIDALGADTAWCTTSPAATFIYRTTNGGNNWTQVHTQTGGFFNAMKFINSSTGFVQGDPVGGRWSLWKSTNGGATWDSSGMFLPQAGSEAGWNNSVLADGNNLWFGTNNTRVYYSTNFGASWLFGATTGTTNSYNIHFNGLMNGLAGGTAIVKSTDGGATYSSVGTVPGTGNINGIEGKGDDFWYVRGTGVYRSTNGGSNWASEHTAGGTLNDVDFADDGCLKGWAVGATGTIARLDGIVVSIGGTNQQIPAAYKLEQNYPNPFNPSTSISFDIPKSEVVELKVFDLLGREVATLISGFRNAGSYRVDFNASHLASGTYFYRLQVGDFIEVKKMVLLK